MAIKFIRTQHKSHPTAVLIYTSFYICHFLNIFFSYLFYICLYFFFSFRRLSVWKNYVEHMGTIGGGGCVGGGIMKPEEEILISYRSSEFRRERFSSKCQNSKWLLRRSSVLLIQSTVCLWLIAVYTRSNIHGILSTSAEWWQLTPPLSFSSLPLNLLSLSLSHIP